MIKELSQRVDTANALNTLYKATRASAKGTSGFLKDACKAFDKNPSASNWLELKAAMIMHQTAKQGYLSVNPAMADFLHD